MTKWLRCYWDEEGIWFYFELDASGQVTRQIELQGPGLTPLTAASLDEWIHAQETRRLAEYEAKYGLTAELPFEEWEGHEPQWLSVEEFEGVWAATRAQIELRPR
ncbi:hypothetical protein ACIODX_27930 [Streptomyces sp. NPDC088190]|uniref:hypothetical protein n=1 Tax=unclassified Streptomyces TaxID=2593676 RepID=UPI002E78E532|nr:hypothetical protein [Streptomyces sp. JV190]MEE1843737.1 hypothetical protein [Streptomyces sp. JV190]